MPLTGAIAIKPRSNECCFVRGPRLNCTLFERATEAMLKMIKLDIAVLERA
jgi:hypothetical protein